MNRVHIAPAERRSRGLCCEGGAVLTVTRHDDGTHTVTGGDDLERFAVELLNDDFTDREVLSYDRETNVITLTASNATPRCATAFCE